MEILEVFGDGEVAQFQYWDAYAHANCVDDSTVLGGRKRMHLLVAPIHRQQIQAADTIRASTFDSL